MLVLLALKKQGSLVQNMGKWGKISGTLSLIVGVLFLIGWFGAGMGIDYIDNQLEENCDSTSGQIGQTTGLDEGQCQDCLLYTSPSPRDATLSRMPSSA